MSKGMELLKVMLSAFVIVGSCCSTSPTKSGTERRSNQPVQQITGDQLSSLPDNQHVRFSAVLVEKRSRNCVEIFVGDDYKTYGGDGKFAIFSRRADHVGAGRPEEPRQVVVSGHMILVKGSTDPEENCGINTGKVFEITDIEE